MAQLVKNLPVKKETQVQSLGGEEPVKKEMATHFSILAWEIPWTEKPGGPQSIALQRVGHDLAAKPPIILNIYIHTATYTKLIKPRMGMIHVNLRKQVTSGEGGKVKIGNLAFRYDLCQKWGGEEDLIQKEKRQTINIYFTLVTRAKVFFCIVINASADIRIL